VSRQGDVMATLEVETIVTTDSMEGIGQLDEA